MKLRLAVRADIPRMISLGERIHAESRFARFSYDMEKLTHGLGTLIDLQARGNHLCLVVENRDGQLIGIFIGALEEYFFSSARIATSILIYVAPEYRGSAAALRMIGTFRDWAKKSGAVEACIEVASGVTIGRTDHFLLRLGFAQSGGNYAMALV